MAKEKEHSEIDCQFFFSTIFLGHSLTDFKWWYRVSTEAAQTYSKNLYNYPDLKFVD